MDSETERMTAELRDELAKSSRRRVVDTRTEPVRFHRLRAMAASPAHCLESFSDERDESLAMRLGSGVHALLLGSPVALWDQPAKSGKGRAPRNGAAWEAFRSTNSHATILSRKEHDRATAMVAAIRRHAPAVDLLLGPGVLREQRIEWTWLGRRCQSTPDARGPAGLVEMKTTRCAEPGRLARDATWRAYHAQVAFYRRALIESTGSAPRESYIVAVESARPYVVTVLRLTERALDRGEQLCRLWMERLLACEAAGEWPGYLETVGDFDVPDDLELIYGVTDEEAGGDEDEDA